MALFQERECIPVGALAVEVDRQDSFYLCAGRGVQDLFDRGCREIEGGRVDVGQQRLGAATENGAYTGEEAEGSGNDCVAGADVSGGQCKPDCIGSAGAADGVRHRTGLGGGLLEAVDLRARMIVARCRRLRWNRAILPGCWRTGV